MSIEGIFATSATSFFCTNGDTATILLISIVIFFILPNSRMINYDSIFLTCPVV